MYETWPAPLPEGGTSEEMALVFKATGGNRLLVLPPLFEEANRLRRQLREVMRLLSLRGIASVLPDLPGCNESLAPLGKQTLAGWRTAAEAAAGHFGATHVLAVRTCAAIAPTELQGWLYAPQAPARALTSLARAQSLSEAETGGGRQPAEIIAETREHGGLVAGWTLSGEMVRELEQGTEVKTGDLVVVDQEEIGGSPLWLRAEIGEDADQAQALADLLARELDR
ncbi:hypothetical protein KUV75_02825 [Qipengyuania gaetbuli]|uniref:hypothetical protein n=1 Tax=Qipengyuania gaetbuli TaxID=266952 RepID=UPI001C99594F|nr:hypothetical protein [Qipengyuania gaetbuli]MBY6013837.1 hypothetical protein [Qipengyuania gaetbuli]